MILLRRFAVIAALMYWQGGFTFYAAVVVPTGTEVLGSSAEQGRVTRLVARSINLSGVAALAIFAWDVLATHSGRIPRWGRWLCWFGMAIALAGLLLMYPHLDRMFLPDEVRFTDRPAFRYWHRVYLWTITVQWGFAVLFAVLTLAAWRAADHGAAAVDAPSHDHR
jgi:hypothetical protein